MQRILFINTEMEEIDINPFYPPFIFESIAGIDAINTSIISHAPAGMDGSVYEDIVMEDREITLNLHVYGKTQKEMYENKLALIKLAGSSFYKRGKIGTLWYENDQGRWWIPAVVKQGARQIGKRIKNYLPMQIVFYCPDSSFRAEEATVDKMAYTGGGFSFPLTIAQPGVTFGRRGYLINFVNDGDQESPLEIEITGTALIPKITKKETGEYIAIQRQLFEGDKLIINTEKGKKQAKIIRETNEVENAMGFIDPTSTWFGLDPGDNLLEYTSGDDGTNASVMLKAWSRYGGV